MLSNRRLAATPELAFWTILRWSVLGSIFACITPWIWYCGLADTCYEFQFDKTMDRDRHCLRRARPPVFVGPDRRLSPTFIQPGSRRKIVSWVEGYRRKLPDCSTRCCRNQPSRRTFGRLWFLESKQTAGSKGIRVRNG